METNISSFKCLESWTQVKKCLWWVCNPAAAWTFCTLAPSAATNHSLTSANMFKHINCHTVMEEVLRSFLYSSIKQTEDTNNTYCYKGQDSDHFIFNAGVFWHHGIVTFTYLSLFNPLLSLIEIGIFFQVRPVSKNKVLKQRHTLTLFSQSIWTHFFHVQCEQEVQLMLLL